MPNYLILEYLQKKHSKMQKKKQNKQKIKPNKQQHNKTA